MRNKARGQRPQAREEFPPFRTTGAEQHFAPKAIVSILHHCARVLVGIPPKKRMTYSDSLL